MNVEMLYQKYGPMVLRRCRFILKDEDIAFDAMQDVFVQILKKQKQLKSTYPSSLLYRIATNICLNKIRYTSRHPEIKNDELINNIAHIDGFESRFEITDILNKIFAAQKESTRVIAFLHYVDGLTLKQVADEVGMSLSGIRKRLRLLQAGARPFKEHYHG